MTLPFTLPDWLPWWAALMLLVPVVLYALALVVMPFSVLGLKGRLDQIEARLDEIQGEVRAVALRLPERGMYLSEAPRPPIPPAQRPRADEERDGWHEAREPRPPAPRPRPRVVGGSDEPPDPQTAPARRPLRADPREHEPPPEPRRTPPRLDWPR
jgi:hypothetical protein